MPILNDGTSDRDSPKASCHARFGGLAVSLPHCRVNFGRSSSHSAVRRRCRAGPVRFWLGGGKGSRLVGGKGNVSDLYNVPHDAPFSKHMCRSFFTRRLQDFRSKMCPETGLMILDPCGQMKTRNRCFATHHFPSSLSKKTLLDFWSKGVDVFDLRGKIKTSNRFSPCIILETLV